MCRSCLVKVNERVLSADLIVIDMKEFDVTLRMDWLTIQGTTIDCSSQKVVFRTPDRLELTFVSGQSRSPSRIISVLKAMNVAKWVVSLSWHSCGGLAKRVAIAYRDSYCEGVSRRLSSQFTRITARSSSQLIWFQVRNLSLKPRIK